MADDEVKIKITVDSSSAEKNLKKVKKEAEDVGKEVEEQSRNMSESLFFNLSNMNMLFSGVAKGISYVGDRLEIVRGTAEKLGNTKFFMGLSSAEIQKIETRLKSVGGSFESFAGAYARINQMFSTRRFQSWGTETYRALTRLKIPYKTAQSSKELMDMIIKGLLNEEDVGTRDWAAGVLGIPSDVLLAYKKGGKSANEGLFLTDEEVRRSQEINNNIRQTVQDIEMIQNKITANWLLPLEEKFVKFRQEFWQWLGGEVGAIPMDARSVGQKKEYVMNRLRQAGLSEAGIRGVIGNLMVESKLDPLAYNEKEGAFGIAQWRNDRLQALKDFAQSGGEDYRTLDTQLAFLLHELMKPKYRGLVKTLRGNNVSKATLDFDRIYEVSAGTSRAERLKEAGVGSLLGDFEVEKALTDYNTTYSHSNTVVNKNVSVVFNGTDGATVEDTIDKVKTEVQNAD